MTTMISNLPRDLIEDIISRVPLRYMKAVRLTCKSWNNLSKSESFTKMHIGKAATREEKTMLIAMMPNNLYLMSVTVDDVNLSTKLKGKLSFLYKQVSIFQVLHCEGLLLGILKDFTRIVVWNPYLGQTRWIDLRYSHCRPDQWNRFCYALGYEDKKSGRSIKVLRFLDYFQKLPETQFFWYELYDFDSGLWTTLDVTPHWVIPASQPSVSLKGNTYWPTRKRSRGVIEHLIGFDFRREKFGPLLPLPIDVWETSYVYVTLSCVKEEKLAALFHPHYSYEYEFEIWITTKIEVEMVSWSKFLKMDATPKIKRTCTFFIDEEKKIYMGSEFSNDRSKTFFNIIGEAKYLRKLDIGLPKGNYCRTPVCSYVPSLVQIKKPARCGMDRMVKQSSFAQIKLRFAAFKKQVNHPSKNIVRC